MKFERLYITDPLLMEFKIYFDNPKTISTSLDPDFIWFRAIQDIANTTRENLKYIIKRGSKIKAFLPA